MMRWFWNHYLARPLAQGGVPTTHVRYDGMIHGFFSMSARLDAGQRVVEEAAAAARASPWDSARQRPA